MPRKESFKKRIIKSSLKKPKKILKSKLKVRQKSQKKSNSSSVEDQTEETKNGSNFKEAIYNSLTLDIVQNIPCRENETFQICSLFDSIISRKRNEFIFICGCPGSGKTLVVQSLLKKYESKLTYHSVNCRKASETANIMLYIMSQISESQKKPVKDLTVWLSKQKGNKTILFVLDEIDQLSNNVRHVFKPLLDLLFNSNLRFSLLGISNDINFSSKLISLFPSCRNNIHSVIFPAYTSEDLHRIIDSRLKFSPPVISDKAKEYLAKNISTSGGDARKLFSTLKNAFDNCFSSNDSYPFIDLPDILKSTKKTDQSVSQIVTEFSFDISLPQWFVFLSFLRIVKRSHKYVDPIQIYLEYHNICQDNNIVPIPSQDFNSTLENLESFGLIKIKRKKNIFGSVNLSVSMIEAKAFLNSQKLKNVMYDRLLATLDEKI
ncbi:Cell division control protein 6 [Thelohanellus kitauei]|uniref:Cell division control protein 6 n=1 Tax=Thelohanellus kitauei TaxID=669202 RepID=A0A0C2MZE2_THEKT|nr:Cell division control protein 6 [Thelohanellus kitauei]